VPFELIPAIDLRGGRCVRLFQGDYAKETAYSDDPAAMARHWVGQGATRLHVVDLDGARSGDQANAAAVESIVRAVDVPVQLGGGVRDIETIERWVDVGVDRVFLGTAAVEHPELVTEAAVQFPGRIAVAADARDGRIAVRGWESTSGEPVVDFVRRACVAGAVAVSYTEIGRDGTLAGVDIDGIRALIEALGEGRGDTEIILAGGVGSLDDVLAASAVRGLDGLITGRAIYEGKLDLFDALRVLDLV
jgi:phosphoribosylformimino-5-aminoimidazole carboxamide ribotide isomerase